MSSPKGGGDPGGTGVVLGVRLLRYAGVQGLSLVVSNALQLASFAVIANFLGPAELGQYAMQFQQYLNHFPRERIMILDQEDFRKDRAETLRRVFEFAGADPGFSHPGFERERHATSRKTRATKMAVRMERASKSRWGRIVPPKVWFALDERLPMKKTIERPDVKSSLTDEALRALRDDAERMRDLAGREFRDWSIWQA